jgi:TRAP-type C4-dicarboxylate transport system substrate-binding protein
MKGKKLFLLGSVILAAALVVNLTATVEAKVYRLKIQSAYPRGDLSMELLKEFAASAEKRSNGQIKITVFAEPELVTWEQLFEATKKGTLDMMHGVGAMWGGVVPVGEIEFGLPYMWYKPGGTDIKENAEIVRNFFLSSGFADLLRQEYGKQNLYWLDMHSYGELFTMATKCFETINDIKGKKFRVEGAWMDFYNNLGARGTYISGMDAYMGLKLGTIDASQWDVSGITGLKWHEVAPYRIMGGMHDVIPGHIVVNMNTWNDLPDALKKALAGAAEDYFNILNDTYLEEMEKVAELRKQGKITYCYLNEDCLKAYREASYNLWDEISKRDPSIAKAVQIVRDWRKTLK